MNRGNAVAVAVAAVMTSAAAGACAQTVGGSAQRSVPPAEEPGRSYGYVDDRCGMLADSSVQASLHAQDVVRPYSGAVCQYILDRGSTILDVTFSWFETGTLDRERALALARGATVSDTEIERHPTLLATRSVTGSGCSATASANPGVLSWWVQIRGQRDADACADAEKLLAATLSSEM